MSKYDVTKKQKTSKTYNVDVEEWSEMMMQELKKIKDVHWEEKQLKKREIEFLEATWEEEKKERDVSCEEKKSNLKLMTAMIDKLKLCVA